MKRSPLILPVSRVYPQIDLKKRKKKNPGLTLALLQVLKFRSRLFTNQVLITSCWSAVQTSFYCGCGWDHWQQAWCVDLPPLWWHQYCWTVNTRDKSYNALAIALPSSELKIFLQAFSSAASRFWRAPCLELCFTVYKSLILPSAGMCKREKSFKTDIGLRQLKGPYLRKTRRE